MPRERRTVSVLGLAAGLALSCSTAWSADQKFEGFLCCNMRSDGSWISDINYVENGKTLIPLGTPVSVQGYGRYRVRIEIAGKKQALGNDYSRDLKLEDFARRYVVPENPAARLSQFSKPIQEAITAAHLAKGMTREQVLMAVGYPVSSENPSLEAHIWRYWLSSFAEFRVKFDDQGLVSDIEADPDTRERVVVE
jgi:hypothetical protein